MRILHLNTYDTGGAALAVRSLHDSLLELGVSSRLAVRKLKKPSREVYRVPEKPLKRFLPGFLQKKCDRLFRPGGRRKHDGHLPFFCDPVKHQSLLEPFLDDCDLIHLHWVADFFDLPSWLPRLAVKAPLVWTCHDMQPFMGAMHYADPSAPEWLLEMNQKELQRRQNALQELHPKRLTVVSPSSLFLDDIQASPLFKPFRKAVLLHGVDTDVFSPLEKSLAKATLGLSGKQVIGFICHDMGEVRKGASLAVESLLKMARSSDFQTNSKELPVLLSAGNGEPVSGYSGPQMTLGFLQSPHLLRLFYSALDAFVFPSLQDSFGLTLLESLSCETPVIAFNTGGASDAIETGVNGWVVPRGDTSAMSEALIEALVRSDLAAMGKRGRQKVQQNFSRLACGQRYVALYEDVIRGQAS